MGPRLFSRGNLMDEPGIVAGTDASMGPRLFSRGNFATALKAAIPQVRFNGATTFQPWKYRLRAEGNSRYAASMEPRLFSRGNNSQDMKKRAAEPASMGPRLVSRGN